MLRRDRDGKSRRPLHATIIAGPSRPATPRGGGSLPGRPITTRDRDGGGREHEALDDDAPGVARQADDGGAGSQNLTDHDGAGPS